MALPRRRPNARVLTASAAEYNSDTSYSKRQAQPWQTRALAHYEEIGELRYASHFYSRQLSRIRIYPAKRDALDKRTPIESGLPVEMLDRIQDAGGGRSQLQSDYGRLMFITGEGVLFGANLGAELERWRFLWLEEVKVDGDVTYRLDADKKVIEEGISYRMWRPSPKNSQLADSPVRSVSDICEELILLTKAVMATATTRMLKGILKIPQEISFGAAEAIGDEDPENNPWIRDLIEHFTGQLENPGAPEAQLPFLIEGGYEYLDRLEWMQMHDMQNDYLERDLRTEAIKRMALGLDFPPEVLLGMTDANHWTAKQVVSDMWRSHGAPIAEQFCDDLGEAYLRPALAEAKYPDWQNVVIDYDDSEVVIAPDRSEDADAAAAEGKINDVGYREMKGIPEAMAPSDDEKRIYLAVKMRDSSLLPEKYRPEDPAPPVLPRGPMPSNGNQPDPEEGPPDPGRREVSRPEARTASAKILGAAELALLRCRELAGSRIRTYKKSCPECFEPVITEPNSLVASVIGQEVLTKLEAPPALKLVSGGTDLFKAVLTGWGFADTQAVALAEMVEVYAARTLFQRSPGPLPSGFAAHVERVQEVSNALPHS